MGGENFQTYGHPSLRSSSRISDHELLQDDESHHPPISALQALFMTDYDEARQRILGDDSDDEDGTGVDMNADIPDGWMEIFNDNDMPLPAVDTSYANEDSRDIADEKRSQPAELDGSSANKLDEKCDEWGRPISPRKPGVDGFTQSEVHHICHNLGIPIRELASFAVPNPDRAHTCLMPMAEVDLLTKNLGFVCKNLGLDVEQIWDLSSDVHDISELGLLSKERTERLCERMGMHLDDLLYLTEEDADAHLLKLIKDGRHAHEYSYHKKSAANITDATHKVEALHEAIAVLGDKMRDGKQQTVATTNTLTSILLSLLNFRHRRDQTLRWTAPFIVTPPSAATKLETQQHHLLTTLQDLLCYDFESVVETIVELFDNQRWGYIWERDMGKDYADLAKWTTLLGGSMNMGLVEERKLESVVQHLQVWLLRQTEYLEVVRDRKRGGVKRQVVSDPPAKVGLNGTALRKHQVADDEDQMNPVFGPDGPPGQPPICCCRTHCSHPSEHRMCKDKVKDGKNTCGVKAYATDCPNTSEEMMMGYQFDKDGKIKTATTATTKTSKTYADAAGEPSCGDFFTGYNAEQRGYVKAAKTHATDRPSMEEMLRVYRSSTPTDNKHTDGRCTDRPSMEEMLREYDSANPCDAKKAFAIPIKTFKGNRSGKSADAKTVNALKTGEDGKTVTFDVPTKGKGREHESSAPKSGTGLCAYHAAHKAGRGGV